MPALPIITDPIVITASRAPEQESRTPASVTIFDQQEIQRLDEPTLANLLRLTPSAAVTSIGPAGSVTEVRIRGAEANHTLLFVDGIKLNDPAGDDSVRFELLNADLASRIEVVRGPQSALWGSDAIGGVIAVNGLDDVSGYHASAEAGSFGLLRASASDAITTGALNLSGAFGWQRATGIDSFGAPGGDKDGYHNLSGRLRGKVAIAHTLRLGFSAIALKGGNQFDGYDSTTFEHTDTLDNNRNILAAGRVWAEFGSESSAWSGRVSATALTSSNRNYVGDDPQNRTRGTRTTLDAQLEHRFSTGAVDHRLIVAAEGERETFRARDAAYGGFTNQDRSREHSALTGEWRVSANILTGDVAVRHDMFNRFKDATSLRASALADVGGGFALRASYAQGIAEPTFFDLYGFFPGNFVGNSSLKPESSRGVEAGIRYRHGAVSAAFTAYRQRLYDEIVTVTDPVTFLQTTVNRDRTSRRSGFEAEAEWQASNGLRLRADYAFLHATEPDPDIVRRSPELRRPKHSGSLAADGSFARWSYGGSIAYVGAHLDRQDNFPYAIVRLHPYWLADARIAYAVSPGIELFARGSNLFDSSYQDSVGYHTEGRGIFGGIRLADRRSSP